MDKRVGLVDVDSRIPNLALMKISAHHKAKGDDVKFYEPLFDRPDLVYASKVFDFTPDYSYFPDCEVLRGGTGYDLAAKLPDEIEAAFPDYSLYGCDYAIGRYTRGCPNNCPWCVVPKMDGRDVRQVAKLSDFWDGQRVVRLLDDNIMADEDVFCRACEELSRFGPKVVWEALDIRRVNDRTARALASVILGKQIHFAWDFHSQDEAVPRGIECLKRNGVKPWRLMFYVLVGFNTPMEYDLYRIETIHNLGADPFVMPYDKSDRYQRDLARWCNNKAIFNTVPFEKYKGGAGWPYDGYAPAHREVA